MTTTPSAPTVPVTDDAQLTLRWADLISAGRSGGRTLWLAWLRPDGTMAPTVIPVEELPARTTPALVGGLLGLHDVVAQAEGRDPDELHLSLVLERPGRVDRGPTASDEEWCELVEEDVAPLLAQGCSFSISDGRAVLQLSSRPLWPRLS